LGLFEVADPEGPLGARQTGKAELFRPPVGDGELQPGAGNIRVEAHSRFEMDDGGGELVGIVQRVEGLGEADAQERLGRRQGHRALVGRHRFGNAPVLVKNLPLELVEVGVVGVTGQQRIDLAKGRG
jgi:hypothetical protein